MKKILIPIVLILIAAGGYFYWQQQQAEPENADQLTLYGNIDVRVVDLSFEVSGRLSQMLVDEGQRVTAGQKLAMLDNTRLQLTRDAAQAQLDAQQAQLDELLAGTRPEQIEQYRAQLDAARIEADNAERNAVRLRDLVKKKLASDRDADDAQAAANGAKANAAAAKATLKLAQAGSRKETIAAARASLQNARTQLQLAQRNLDDSVLIAPQSGIVQNRILEPGDMASAQTPALTLVSDDQQWVRVYVGETDLGKVKPGQPVTIHSDSFADKTYRGWVGSISPSAEFTPKSVQTPEIRTDLVYQTRVYLCQTSDELRQGMPVTVQIDTTASADANAACQ